MDNIRWKLSVSCFTFNQSKYITQTMDGFVMQQTNFPYICTIVDDASKDNAQLVIKKYIDDNFIILEVPDTCQFYSDDAEVCFAQHKQNKNCYFAAIFLKRNHYSIGKDTSVYLLPWREGITYLAICEGDDYWIDSNKIQIQVDFLDSNQDYSIVRTNVNRFIQDGEHFEYDWFSSGNGLLMKDTLEDYIVYGWFAAPCTWIYRYGLLNRSTGVFVKRGCFQGDIAILLSLLLHGKIKYIDKTTTVYRVLKSSASHFLDLESQFRFWLSVKNTRWFFIKYLSLKDRLNLWYKDTHTLAYYVKHLFSLKNLILFLRVSLYDFGKVLWIK